MPKVFDFDVPTEDDAYAFKRAAVERYKQHDRFGDEDHTPATWLAILTEEVGEMAAEVLRMEREGVTLRDYRKELEHVAAVSLAALACARRQSLRAYEAEKAYREETKAAAGITEADFVYDNG